MLTNEQFLKYLRDGLNHLYEPQHLRQSPLAALFGVADRHDTSSALRRILVEAIGSLKPKTDEPAQSQAWETYESLFYRYVEQLTQRDVADQLGMSVRTLRRRERVALETLTSLLWEQFDLDAVLEEDTDGAIETTDHSAPDGSAVSEELAWVKKAPQSPTDVNQLLEGVLDLAQRLAGQHHVRLDTAVADGLPRLAADPVAVRHSLLNLLSVVIPRASGGQVVFSARSLRWEVEFRVRCAKYTSGPKPALNNETDSLNIAQQLAELCGGLLDLAVDARAFDATLTLPALEQLPVLVIDDHADTLQLLQRYAAGTRYHLITTRDPEQALSLAENVSPQVIVLDVMMPKVDGWEVLGQLRQHPLTRHIPIVVCTILRQQEIAHFLGASAFVRKPVTRQVFLGVLDRQIEPTHTGSR